MKSREKSKQLLRAVALSTMVCLNELRKYPVKNIASLPNFTLFSPSNLSNIEVTE